ncbi:NAD(P)-dependent oxidoreductase [Sphingomonas sp. 37zxx]|uniref:NAD(P)-dependent oxidoreductase n=1 Tax=Sphingomonas sp. 37zxx TaxID=1550073 RepID=UPI00053BDE4A|nr:NAD(P)-dependent oxidoreductase [Sphingomonas sp. 37zxx]
METPPTFIGFGEAAMAFARAGDRGHDLKLTDPATIAAKQADFAAAGVTAIPSLGEAVTGASTILLLVTADQALTVARAAVPNAGTLWLDGNSVAPDTKRAAAAALGPQVRYVDMAIMAPVEPARRNVPILLAGPHAAAGAAALRAMGFTQVAIAGESIGDASAIKMIRSVMVKGIEALSAECALAAEAAGVRAAVIASLDASWPGADWGRRFDYNLDRMMLHGNRRTAEMEEVVATLDALGTGSAMSRATAERQRTIGRLGETPPAGLTQKLRALLPSLTTWDDAA